MPLDVLGRTRVTMTGAESFSWPGKVRVILLIPVVLGIVLWNFGS